MKHNNNMYINIRIIFGTARVISSVPNNGSSIIRRLL